MRSNVHPMASSAELLFAFLHIAIGDDRESVFERIFPHQLVWTVDPLCTWIVPGSIGTTNRGRNGGDSAHERG